MSACSVKGIINRAKAVNASYVALTDINTMTGIMEFINCCKENNITPIVGCEITIENDGDIVFLAKNYDGYIELCKMITEANRSLQTNKESVLLSFEQLCKIVSGRNLFVLTGGEKGLIYSILLKNHMLFKEIADIKAEQEKYDSPNNKAYIGNLEILNLLEDELSELDIKKINLQKLASKKYHSRLKGLNGIADKTVYQEKYNELQAEMKESDDAKIELNILKGKIANLKRKKTIISKKIGEMEGMHVFYRRLEEKIASLKDKVINPDNIISLCCEKIRKYQQLFNDNLYIEVFNDGTEIIKNSSDIVKTISEQTKCELVGTSISYILDEGEERALQLIRSIKDNNWIELKPGSESYYIKSLPALEKELNELYSRADVSTALKNMSKICQMCTFSLPNEKYYPKYRNEDGSICEDSAACLTSKVEEGIMRRKFTAETFDKTYIERYKYELGVIIKMGFADYLLIVADFINYAKNIGMVMNEYQVGYSVGPGRGSAAGSLVCYLLGITNIDPIKYKLKFERFLNIKRVSMPDIDTDFSNEVRAKTIEYVKKRYGENTVALIRTKETQQTRNSIRNSARLIGIKKYKDSRKLYDLGSEIINAIPKDNTKSILEIENDILLNSPNTPDTYEIIHNAGLIENTMTILGIHAAGVVIGNGKSLDNYVPLLYNTDMQQWAVQYDMIEIEQAGCLKMDFLGLVTLDILSECVRRIKKYKGITVDLDNIPFEREVFENIFSKGNTVAIFQSESAGMRQMFKSFKPETLNDIILLIAAYRPGPMEFIPNIIKVKNGEEIPYYCVPELKNILDETYGYPIYQEQLMDIFAVCAGFSQEEADIIRRYMSKKKTEKFITYKAQFINGLIAHGATENDAVNLWDSLIDFSKYAFNKSHATSYAIVAYQTAYLKHYYPEFFMCAALNNITNNKKQEKISQLIYECKNMGINILLPDINKAYECFENSSDGIIYGLCKIKSIKNNAKKIIDERQNGRYSSFKDFIYRNGSNSLTKKLVMAGAMDEFGQNREQMIMALNPLCNIADAIKKARNDLEVLASIDVRSMSLNDRTKHNKRILSKKSDYEEAIKSFNEYEYDKNIEENPDILINECDLLGYYISAHPLDAYLGMYKSGNIKKIIDINLDKQKLENASFVGMIKNLRMTKRKSDGKDMAFFELEDVSGTIDVCCFTKEYEKYSEFIKANSIVKIYAKCIIEEKDDDKIAKLIVISIEKCIPHKNPILVSIPNLSYELYTYNILKEYSDNTGHEIWIHYQNNGFVGKKNFYVSKKVLSLEDPNMYITSVFNY